MRDFSAVFECQPRLKETRPLRHRVSWQGEGRESGAGRPCAFSASNLRYRPGVENSGLFPEYTQNQERPSVALNASNIVNLQ